VPDLVAAATLRREATAACDARSWSACLSKLDEARSADPAGDETPAMKSLRARALEGIEEKRRPEPPR
jgi:hypothetical protein